MLQCTTVSDVTFSSTFSRDLDTARVNYQNIAYEGNVSVQFGTDLLTDAISVVAEFSEMKGKKSKKSPIFMLVICKVNSLSLSLLLQQICTSSILSG